MARTRKTLPDDFPEVLASGNLDAMQAVFQHCRLDATHGLYKDTALGLKGCPVDLAQWLIAEGLDPDTPNRYGDSPIVRQAEHGDLDMLAFLVGPKGIAQDSLNRALHAATQSHQFEAMKYLVANSADMESHVKFSDHTVVESAASRATVVTLPQDHTAITLLIQLGATVTERTRSYLRNLSRDVSRASDTLRETRMPLAAELCQLTGTQPVRHIEPHDGTSPITYPSDADTAAFTYLWNYLVPNQGPARTVQGEVIRIAGRIDDELSRNGGGNWDSDYVAMCDFWATTVPGHTGTIAMVRDGSYYEAATDQLCQASVDWVLAHPEPIPLGEVPYRR